jgi:hypothetical protein
MNQLPCQHRRERVSDWFTDSFWFGGIGAEAVGRRTAQTDGKLA